MASANGNGNGNNEGALRARVEFKPNEPLLLLLDYDEGKPIAGRWGDQFMVSFDRRTKVAWLDPDVHDLILRSGAKAGDEIGIVKRETRTGNKRNVQWEVTKVEEEPHNEPPSPAPVRRTAAPAAAPPAPAVAQPAPRRIAPPKTDRAAVEQAAQMFAACIQAAVEAAQITEHENREMFQLNWTQADIRAMATTIYISWSGKGGN